MRTTILSTLLLISAALLLTNCDDNPDPVPQELCDNLIDDDQDGFVDCEDDDCSDAAVCASSNSNNPLQCQGEAPLAFRQEGVCAGALSRCNPETGQWVEPDYTELPNYESTEISCDGLDNDCDGLTDQGLKQTFYQDQDQDGYGSSDHTTAACSVPPGYAENNDDCDDSVETGATCHDSCTTFYRDQDDDSYGDPSQPVFTCSAPEGYVENSLDCGPTSPENHPGALEICDGQDNDCDWLVDAGGCSPTSSCEDEGGTVAAYCACDPGYIEDPATPGLCVENPTPAFPSLVVSEIMIQPSTLPQIGQGQFFEVHNSTDATLNITGVKFIVQNSTESATGIVTAPTFIAPRGHYVVGATADSTANGGVSPDLLFSSMPTLNTEYGQIQIIPPDLTYYIDHVEWDHTWDHTPGSSLILSPGTQNDYYAIPGDLDFYLNDDRTHWCHSRFSQLTGGDYATPGVSNDHCLPTSCGGITPDATALVHGDYSDPFYIPVYEPGRTDSTGEATQLLMVELGTGPEATEPDTSWSFKTCHYSSEDAQGDTYSCEIRATSEGTFSYAARASMDGGLSWLLCGTTQTYADGSTTYQAADNGTLTVQGWAQWAMSGEGAGEEYGKAVAVDPLGEVVVAGVCNGSMTIGGQTLSCSQGEADILLAKLDQTGTLLWALDQGGPGSDTPNKVATDAMGNIYLLGNFTGSTLMAGVTLTAADATSQNFFIAKYSPSGLPLWARSATTADDLEATGLAVTPLGEVVVSGYYNGSADFGAVQLSGSGGTESFIVKYSTDGSALWGITGTCAQEDRARDVAVDSAGNIVVTGSYAQSIEFSGNALSSTQSFSGYILKLDSAGTPLWLRNLTTRSALYADTIAIGGSDQIILAGAKMGGFFYTSDDPYAPICSSNMFLTRLESDGEHTWSKCFGRYLSQYQEIKSINPQWEGSIYISLTSFSSPSIDSVTALPGNSHDVYVAKIEDDGTVDWVKGFGSPYIEVGGAMALSPTGGLFVTGGFEGTMVLNSTMTLNPSGAKDLFLIRFRE